MNIESWLQSFGFYLLRFIVLSILFYSVTYGICYYFHLGIITERPSQSYEGLITAFMYAFMLPLLFFAKGHDFLELDMPDIAELLFYNAIGYAFVLAFFIKNKPLPEIKSKKVNKPLKRGIE